MVNLLDPEGQQPAQSSNNQISGFLMRMLVDRLIGAVIGLVIFLVLVGVIVFAVFGSH